MSVQTAATQQQSEDRKKLGISLARVFTRDGTNPFDEITWVSRDAVVGSGKKKVFEQPDVEVPDFWSANAVNITAAKYFRGKLGTPQRERSVRHMVERVAKEVRKWGEKFGYFTDVGQAQIFEDELSHLLVYQKGAFNSPVWFNVGTTPKPQCSACFILSTEDTMPSILDWIHTEGMIFKGGSGSGINLSNLRSSREMLSGGGYASGPVSFMRGADSVAGMIKSGGTTRRAAKMVVLNDDHPDVLDFIRCKAEEEKKIHALAAAGYDMSDLNNNAWTSIQFQNANNSVRITDAFMHAVENNSEWHTRFVKSKEVADTYNARDLLMTIAEAAWECGDPGVQFDTTINNWHTCPNTGRINASNPCSEYMHLDNSACNLASINLMKFVRDDGTFMVDEFCHAVRVFILAQDILVDASSYPTEKIAENAHKFRELGLGFANLGALLMTKGFPYDSDGAVAWAGAISSILAGEAYRHSAEIAAHVGAYEGYRVNREPMLHVIDMHREASKKIAVNLIDDPALAHAATTVWDDALRLGEQHGFRNSQVTVIAPTGTIALMMDCDTTGIEPDFSLVKMKQLVGGGWMKIVNQGITRALKKLNYTNDAIERIVQWVSDNGTVEGAPDIKEEHISIFDCAVRPAKGTRSISWRGHVKLVAAVQPFISGAISKTFNMTHETTKEEIFDAYLLAWKSGIKAFAVYRDGSKATQPLQTAESQKKNEAEKQSQSTPPHNKPYRKKLPVTHPSFTHKFEIVGHEGYLTYSAFDDGKLAELFIRMAKQGSTLSGLLDSFAVMVSISLQYGVPLKHLARKFIHTRFEPAGFTENPEIQIATSIVDYIFKYLALQFLDTETLGEFGLTKRISDESHEHADSSMSASDLEPPVAEKIVQASLEKPEKTYVVAETVCRICGGMMVRTGTCLTCLQCGEASGGC